MLIFSLIIISSFLLISKFTCHLILLGTPTSLSPTCDWKKEVVILLHVSFGKKKKYTNRKNGGTVISTEKNPYPFQDLFFTIFELILMIIYALSAESSQNHQSSHSINV